MDYPSTTQALFALIVMIIVLAFILVYCCWGTFICSHPEELACNDDRDSLEGRSQGRESPNPHAVVILPYHSMIYVGDGQTQRVYQIPIRDDKPPSYGDIFTDIPSSNGYSSHVTLAGSEPPPSYDDCFRSNSSEETWISAPQGHFITFKNGSISNSQNIITPNTSTAQLLLPSSSQQRTSSISVLRPNSVLAVNPSRNSHSTTYTSHSHSPEVIQTVTFLSSNSPILRTNISQTLTPVTLESLGSTSSNPCISSSSSSRNNSLSFLPSLRNLQNLHTALRETSRGERFQNAEPTTTSYSKST